MRDILSVWPKTFDEVVASPLSNVIEKVAVSPPGLAGIGMGTWDALGRIYTAVSH